MAFFMLKLSGPRPSFPGDASGEELAAMAEHSVYWKSKAEDRLAIAVGPVFDPAGPFGMAIVDCADPAAARLLADDDPVIRAGLGFGYDIFPIPSLILRQA
ncbi:YciI family protein [Gellertiella hungarica]|uniref:Uncharacterized protein YciI n=1 Tax=Gellertiella hungarica TaxID=1572859 RepID=A0A7W6J5L9_9HYPH|nr:YciI family protein [Gellertiella hungarica]MBB4065220.1 uncharacterized protein YciI [Gellertiella hungarica]